MNRVITNRNRQADGGPAGRRMGIRLLVVLAVAVLGITNAAFAGQVSIPYFFVDGTVALAAEVNSNFDTLAAESNSQDLRLDALEAGLSLDIEFTKGLAGPGDADAAFILIAVNSPGGPVTGLSAANFEIACRSVPPGAFQFVVDSISSFGSGVYRVQVSPFSSGSWSAGRYLYTVVVSASGGSVSGVGHLDID